MSSTKPTGQPARTNKYVPSAKQRAEDDELRKRLENIDDVDMEQFNKALDKALKPEKRRT